MIRSVLHRDEVVGVCNVAALVFGQEGGNLRQKETEVTTGTRKINSKEKSQCEQPASLPTLGNLAAAMGDFWLSQTKNKDCGRNMAIF